MKMFNWIQEQSRNGLFNLPALLVTLVIVVLFAFSVAHATVIDIADIPGEDDPRWFVVYEYREADDARWRKVLLDNEGLPSLAKCHEFGRFVTRLQMHDYSRIECIPNRPIGE